MMMNIGVGDFISGAGQRNDVLDRMRRRLDVYRQRHDVNATHFDGRYNEETEKQRQETAAYHKKWIDSKAKRTTGKAKGGGGQRGDNSVPSNGFTKQKRKSQNDEQLPQLKNPRNDEVGTEQLGYDFGPPSDCSAVERGQKNKTASQLKIPPAAANFADPQFRGNAALSADQDEIPSLGQDGIGLQASGAAGVRNSDLALNIDAALLAASFCKKEPTDDSNGVSAEDEAPDLMSFDEELYEFLDGIGRDGDLPADILQVLNQGELDSIDFHDTPPNGKDNVLSTPVKQGAMSTSSVRDLLSSACGDMEPPDRNRPSPLGQSSTPGANQVSVNMKLGHELINDGEGPAAETLKQMAARRNQVTPTPGLVYQQNQQLTSSQMYSCPLPYPGSELAPATPIPNPQRCAMAMTQNSIAIQSPSLQSCIQEQHETRRDYYLINQMNPYAAEPGFFDGTANQPTQSRVPGSYIHYQSSNNGDPSHFAHRFPNQNSQMEKHLHFGDPGSTNPFNSERLSVAVGQCQQYCGQPTPTNNIPTTALSYLQTVGRNTNGTMNHRHLHHLATCSTTYSPRLQDQVTVKSGLIKRLCLPSQYAQYHINSGSTKIKVEDGVTVCGAKIDRGFVGSAGGQPAMQSYGHSSVGRDFTGVGYTHEGSASNQMALRPTLQPSLPPYIKSCDVRAPNSTNAFSNLTPASHPNVPGVWMHSAALKNSLMAYAADSASRPIGPSNGPNSFLNEYKQTKQCQALPPSYHIQRQQVLTPPSRSWNGSEAQMGSVDYQPSANEATISNSHVMRAGHLLQRQNSAIDRANAMLLHSGTNMILQGHSRGDGRNPPVHHLGSNREPSAGHAASVDQFLSYGDVGGYFSSENQKQMQESMNHSIELSLIDDLINGK